MFKNRALQVTMVKTPNNDNAVDEKEAPRASVDEIATIVMYHAEHAAKIAAALYVGRKLLNTACEIAIIKAAK